MEKKRINIRLTGRAVFFGLTALSASLFFGCGNTGTKNEAQLEKVEQPTAAVVPETQDVSFKDKDGKVLQLSALRGKVVFINFWATWCPPCIHELPSIDQLSQSLKDNKDIVFLMVDVDGDIGKSSSFMAENKYDLPLYVPESEIPAEFLGQSIPTTVILDKAGKIVERLEGSRDYGTPEIKKALQDIASGS
ncbi:TlpA disulfide reductase family protein [Sphingobacterium sp.]|jgi:thiol-disulfide isomerase/thioredoxin|uniref:TlpA family protein disulfide reductase n=1 Tax=Sphingobacterium sp. TaxID=341027 RepID=UPI00289F4F28|nr:TlpA disulfide reductase family protein [Sphingobacterium sp.]